MIPDPTEKLSSHFDGRIVDQFDRHASQNPDAVCLVQGPVKWNYGEVCQASHLLADVLRAKGAGRGSVVLIYAARTPSLSLALLTCLRAGCVFCVLDPKYPAANLLEKAKHVQPVGILNTAGESSSFDDLCREIRKSADIFHIDVPASPATARHHGPDLIPHPGAAAAEPSCGLCYVTFTSGTTGSPRAVRGGEGPLAHFLAWQQATFQLGPADRVSVLSGLAHDPLLRDILLPLWTGASAWFPGDRHYEYPGELLEWMADSQITVTHLTPSLGHFLLNSPVAQDERKQLSLRAALFGGETLHWKLVERFQTTAPGCVIINCYGATETPQVAGYYVVGAVPGIGNLPLREPLGPVPIGQGIEGVQLLVLDERKALCVPGQEGEIHVRSPYRASSVVDLSHQPVSAFIQNPFTDDESDLLYQTGDRGIYLEGHGVLVRGRKDRQIKIRGFRVDLSEVEQAVQRLPEIRESHVDVRETEDGFRMVLFAVPTVHHAGQPVAIRKSLEQRLPRFMVPESILLVQALPRTPNGKVDRQVLLKMTAVGPPSSEANPLESTSLGDGILSVLRRELDHPQLQAGDDFMALGVDSLKSVQLCCALQKQTGLRVGMSMLLGARSVQHLASLLVPENQSAVASTSLAAVTAPDNPPVQTEGGVEKKPRLGGLIPRNESFFSGLRNRLFQILARVAPDSWRIKLHRARGVQIGEHVSIGYDTIVETAYPFLVSIGNHVNIGMRVTVIGHFRGIGDLEKGRPTVEIRDHAFVGPGVIILPNVVIGEGAVVAAGSVVTTSIPAHTLAQGNPAKVVATCGLSLSGDTTYQAFLESLVPLASQDPS